MKLVKIIILNIGFSSNFATDHHDSGLSNFTATVSSYRKINDFKFWSGTSYMKEFDLESFAVFGGIAIEKLSVLFEIDNADNYLAPPLDSFASMVQITYKPMQGLYLLAKYDSFDRNEDVAIGSLERHTIGFEIYPLNILEVSFQARQYQVNHIEFIGDPFHTAKIGKTEYLIQAHTWF